MKQLLSFFLFLLPCLAWAQYPSNGNQKITLGEQTTADGLIYRGVAATDTVRKPSIDTMAYMVLDTTTNIIWHYKKATSNAWLRLNLLPSDTASFNYVNTYGTQTVNGAKTFSSATTFSSTATATKFIPQSGGSESGNGMYLPATNSVAISSNGVNRLYLNANGQIGYNVIPSAWGGGINNVIEGRNGTSIAFGFSNLPSFYFFSNGYFDGTDLRYKISNFYASYGVNNNEGTHEFATASSGTTGNVITSNLRLKIKNDGEVQVAGTTDRGAYNLQVNGTGVWGAGDYINGSDFNIKNNIEELDSSLSLINNLKPVTFKYDESYNKDESYQVGFIAQDVFQNFENKKYVNGIIKSDGDILSMSYSSLIPILTKAIQEQQALIKALEQRIINLENK
jgi:hypothetical protein